MINAISAADIAFIMSSSTSVWLLSPLECSPQKQNGWTLRFCFWGWIMWKMYNKTIIEFGFPMISWIIKTWCLCYLPQPSAWTDNTDLGFDNSWYHAQPHPIIVYYLRSLLVSVFFSRVLVSKLVSQQRQSSKGQRDSEQLEFIRLAFASGGTKLWGWIQKSIFFVNSSPKAIVI